MRLVPKRVEDGLNSLDEAFFAEVERLRRLPHDDNEEDVKWQDGTDPWGLDWAWLVPSEHRGKSQLDDQLSSGSTMRRISRQNWAAAVATVAAALILGLFVGRNLLPQPNAFRLANASAEIESVVLRGPEAKDIRVKAPFSGFATVLALSPQQDAQVTPSWGDADIEVPANDLSTAIALPDGATHALFVVTETPAGEPIRLWIEDDSVGPFYAADVESLQVQVTNLLEQKGYRHVAVGTSVLNSTP